MEICHTVGQWGAGWGSKELGAPPRSDAPPARASYQPGTGYETTGYEPLTRNVDMRLPGKGNSTPMVQGRSTKIISIIKWIRTSRLSIKNSLSYEPSPKTTGYEPAKRYTPSPCILPTCFRLQDLSSYTSILRSQFKEKYSAEMWSGLGFDFGVSGFRFQFWGFGFQISVLGVRVLEFRVHLPLPLKKLAVDAPGLGLRV